MRYIGKLLVTDIIQDKEVGNMGKEKKFIRVLTAKPDMDAHESAVRYINQVLRDGGNGSNFHPLSGG